MAFGRCESICRAGLLLALVAPGCSNVDSSPTGAGGSGGAGSVFDGSVDTPSVDDVAAPEAADGDDPKPTTIVLADDIFVSPFGGPQVDGGADVTAPPSDASDPPPIRYMFDADIEGAELVPVEPGQARPREALVHNGEDAQGSLSSGSLEVQRTFEPYDTDARVYPTGVRLFSAPGGDRRDWRGYRITGRFKALDGAVPCASDVYFYARTGADRAIYVAGGIYLSTREWRSMTVDLPVTATRADLSQIVEFGFVVDGEFCIPN